jgi:hypothetical protein
MVAFSYKQIEIENIVGFIIGQFSDLFENSKSAKVVLLKNHI